MQSLRSIPSLNFIRHINIRRLTLSIASKWAIAIFFIKVVVVNADSRPAVAGRGNVYDAGGEGGGGGREEGGLEELEKEEVGEMVCGELGFETVRREGSFGDGHYASVIDEHVHLSAALLQDLLGCGSDIGKFALIHFDELDVARLEDVGEVFGGLGGVADREEYFGPGGCNCTGGFTAYTGGATCDDEDFVLELVGEMLILDDLEGSGAGVAWAVELFVEVGVFRRHDCGG